MGLGGVLTRGALHGPEAGADLLGKIRCGEVTMGEWMLRNVAGGGGVAGGLLDQGFGLLSGERDHFSPWEVMQAGVMGGVTAAASAAGMWRHQQACFAGDMPILSENGSLRADAVGAGDRLWSQSESDPQGEVALRVVEEVFVRFAAILHVHVRGRIIKTTAEHPFYIVGKGWIPAGALQIGDLLQTDDKRLLPVEGVADSGSFETVYNFRVAEYHTYFVGCDEWGFSVWAHNDSCPFVNEGRQPTLKEIANAIEGKYGPVESLSNEARVRIIEALRDPKQRHYSLAPEFPGHIHEAVLVENIQAMQEIRAALGKFDPHVVLGQQTGGAFLAEAVVAGHPELAGRLRTLAKPGEGRVKPRVDPSALRAAIEQAAPGGSPRVALVDSYMGGGFADQLRTALKSILPDMPGAQVRAHFIRETLGFSESGTVLRGRAKGPLASQYQVEQHRVRLLVGDDMGIVTGGTASSPLNFFRGGGQIVGGAVPAAGHTTRSLLVSLLEG